MNDTNDQYSDAALAAAVAVEAGRLLRAVREEVGYDRPFDLGAAGDRRANTLILDRLRSARPGDAVLSEEAHDDLRRLRCERVWIVDPLDGTREFSMPRRSDWAVHIALWQAGKEITDAAVALPALDEVFRSDTVRAGAVADGAGITRPVRIAVSASRAPAVVSLLSRSLAIEAVPIGSAGAKAMAVVRGDVDAYVHAGGQWEWDSAAPAGVVLAAGLHASRLDGSPLRYNQPRPYLPDFVMCRPELAAPLLDAIRRAAS